MHIKSQNAHNSIAKEKMCGVKKQNYFKVSRTHLKNNFCSIDDLTLSGWKPNKVNRVTQIVHFGQLF
jgi:hypothetical protein